MTDLVKRRHAALNTAARQRKGIVKTLRNRTGGINSDEEEQSRRRATSLQGLMDSPRKQSVPLTAIIGTRPGSSHRRTVDASPSSRRRHDNNAVPSMKPDKRTAMLGGTHRGPPPEPLKCEIPTDSDESDDLDAQPSWPRKQRVQHSMAKQSVTERSHVPQQTSRYRSQSTPFLASSGTTLQECQSPSSHTPTSRQIATPNDDDDDDPLTRLRARRAEQKRRRMSNFKTQDNNKISGSLTGSTDSIPFT